MTVGQEVDFDRSLLGKEVDGGTLNITREKVIAYAKAVGETNPIYFDDAAAKEAGYDSIIAPPSYVNVLVSSGRPDAQVRFGTVGLHSGQAVEHRLPIYVGDTIRSVTSLEDVYAKTGRSGTMVFTVWKTTLTNQNGHVVAVARVSSVRR